MTLPEAHKLLRNYVLRRASALTRPGLLLALEVLWRAAQGLPKVEEVHHER